MTALFMAHRIVAISIKWSSLTNNIMVLIKVLLIWFFLRLYWFVGTVEHAKTGVSSCAYIVEVYSNMDVCIAGAGDDPLGRFEKKLGVVKAYTRSVVSGDHTSLYLSGPGGTSKSWTVRGSHRA